MNRANGALLALVTLLALGQPVLASQQSQELVRRGCHQLDLGNYSQAIGFFSAAIRQEPSDLDARRHLSAAYIGAGMSMQAVMQLKAIASVQSPNAGDFAMLGEAYAQLGDKNNSISAYKKAIALEPGSRPARLGLAQVLVHSGDLRSATAFCTETLRSSKDPELVKQVLDLVRSMRERKSAEQIVNKA